MEYDAGDFKTAVKLTSIVEDYVWPDFKVGVEGAWISSVGSTINIIHER